MTYYVKKKWTTAKKSNYGGYTYDSGFEANYARELDLRVKAKDIKSYEKQKTLELIVNGYLVCTYRIDFIVYHNDKTIEYVETKGVAFPVWRIKFKLFEALYGDKENVKITVVQQGNNPRWRVPKPRRIKK